MFRKAPSIERIRAGGSGLGGVLTPTGVGTVVEEGKQQIEVDGKSYLLETALRADFALINAFLADYLGNLDLCPDCAKLQSDHRDGGGYDDRGSRAHRAGRADCAGSRRYPGPLVDYIVANG